LVLVVRVVVLLLLLFLVLLKLVVLGNFGMELIMLVVALVPQTLEALPQQLAVVSEAAVRVVAQANLLVTTEL
jgi:hypothetical protein